MSFSRRILHHGDHPAGIPVVLSAAAVRSCWFELHRQGGCGAAELVLGDQFELREEIQIGDWISFESQPAVRWYLGRVEERRAESPARVRLRLEGMGIQLNEVFPGGFGSEADGQRPHRYAGTDLFPFDPDYSLETVDAASSAEEVVRLLLQQYVVPATEIAYVPMRVESPSLPAPVASLKVRGEETARTLIKDLALRAQSASWGVDAAGEFFFLRRRDAVALTLREGRDLTQLAEFQDRDLVFNRILLTGDYVYDPQDHSADVARRSYRWRGNYFEPVSRTAFGERRIRLWLPWVRTQTDSITFAKEFFRNYSQPRSKFFLETTPQPALPVPWLHRVRLEDRHGEELITARVESLRVQFDHAPLLRLELGPEDPRTLWPEPPHDERWELPEGPPFAGGPVEFTDIPPSGGSSLEGLSSSSGASAESSGGLSSDGSEGGSNGSTGETSSEDEPPEDSSTGEGESTGNESSSLTSGEGGNESSSGTTFDSESDADESSTSGADSTSGANSDSEGDSGSEDESSGEVESGSDSSSSSSGSEGSDPITFVW